MDVSDMLRRLDEERRSLVRDGEVIEVLPSLTRLRAADGSHHTVIFSSLTAETVDGAIAGEVEHHRRLEAGFEWKAYAHDGPPDLLDRLRRQGFEVGPREVVLACDLTGLPPWMTNDDAAGRAVRVERVDSAGRIADFQRVAEAVFGKDYSFTAGQLAEAVRTGSTQHRGYIAYAADEPVSVGRLYTHPDSHFGGLYGGGTRAAYRGRGFYRALIAARARDAAALGARYLTVDALPTSRPVLERLGFRRLTDTWPCEWRV